MRSVACARATLPADVFTKRQFHKDNYEICEDGYGDDEEDDDDDDDDEGRRRPPILFFLRQP